MKLLHTTLGILLSALLMAGCNEYTALQKTTDYEVKYEAAKQCYAEGQYNRAALLLNDIIVQLKGTDKAEESLFLLGMSSLGSRDYTAATSYFRKYYQSYPRGIYAAEANFYAGLALYRGAPEIRLDQSDTYAAVTEFNNFLENYPTHPWTERAQNTVFELQDKLVEKEYLSAKLYYDLGSYFGNCTNGGSNYQACIVTAQNAITDYPYTSRREDLAYLILRAKFDLAEQSIREKTEERYHSAIDEYYGFCSEFPESKYAKQVAAMWNKAKPYVEKNEQ